MLVDIVLFYYFLITFIDYVIYFCWLVISMILRECFIILYVTSFRNKFLSILSTYFSCMLLSFFREISFVLFVICLHFYIRKTILLLCILYVTILFFILYINICICICRPFILSNLYIYIYTIRHILILEVKKKMTK
jgi:hypothetical protein